MKRFPIGIQDFESLITEGYHYVDKTELIYRLVKDGKVYFLSRPRRFGKSLLVSTLKAYFEGKKHLFEGLAMERLEQNWIEHPVIHIDLSGSKFHSADKLCSELNRMLASYENIYGKDINESSYEQRFAGIIKRANEQTGKKVVVLIDEYDAPLLDVIADQDAKAEIRNVLRSFFSPLKSSGAHLQFLFLTGITKFSQLSIFSELNNLNNISMLPRFSAICGITEEELYSNFKEDIGEIAINRNETYEQVCALLKERYDGYHFSHRSPDIYNPFSLLHALYSGEFENYWFSTGTPTSLIELLSKSNVNIDDLEEVKAKKESFDRPITDGVVDFAPMFYQSGYLTIKRYDTERKSYVLGFPNQEVREGFLSALLPYYNISVLNDTSEFFIDNFIDDLTDGNIENFLIRTKSFFSSIPYELNNKTEKHYQTVFYIFCMMLGQNVEVEKSLSAGRVDLFIRTKNYLYLFEFKLDSTADKALEQINSKDYASPYEAGERRIVKVGVNFNTQTRTLGEWVIA